MVNLSPTRLMFSEEKDHFVRLLSATRHYVKWMLQSSPIGSRTVTESYWLLQKIRRWSTIKSFGFYLQTAVTTCCLRTMTTRRRLQDRRKERSCYFVPRLLNKAWKSGMTFTRVWLTVFCHEWAGKQELTGVNLSMKDNVEKVNN